MEVHGFLMTSSMRSWRNTVTAAALCALSLAYMILFYRDEIKDVFTSLPDVFPESQDSKPARAATTALAVIMIVLSLVLDVHATLSYALETRPTIFKDRLEAFWRLHAAMCNQLQHCWSWLLGLRDEWLRRPKYVFKLQTLSAPLLSS